MGGLQAGQDGGEAVAGGGQLAAPRLQVGRGIVPGPGRGDNALGGGYGDQPLSCQRGQVFILGPAGGQHLGQRGQRVGVVDQVVEYVGLFVGPAKLVGRGQDGCGTAD